MDVRDDYLYCLTSILPPQELTRRLQHKKWEKTSNKDSVTQFEYAQQQITARPRRVTGPGWEAAIDGHHAVGLQTYKANKENNKLKTRILGRLSISTFIL